jgi:hypothetical protein
MKTNRIVCVVVATITLALVAACGETGGMRKDNVDTSGRPQEHQAKDCHGRDCDVTIGFICSDDMHPTPQTCTPFADPELIAVDKGHKIRFTISYTWPFMFAKDDGIRFSSGYFPCPSKTDLRYTCDIRIPDGTAPAVYKYSIHIKDFDIVDPWVVNY